MCMCGCVTHSDEIGLGSDTTEHLLLLGEVQSTDVPVDLHSTSEVSIVQALYKLLAEFLQQRKGQKTSKTTRQTQPLWSTVIWRQWDIWDKQGTLMLSTSDPGGDSCRAMVSDVSMVKYTSMGHSFFSGGEHTHTHTTRSMLFY